MSSLADQLRGHTFACTEIDDVSVPSTYTAELLMETAAAQIDALTEALKAIEEFSDDQLAKNTAHNALFSLAEASQPNMLPDLIEKEE